MRKERRGWGAAPPRIGKGPSGPEAIISLPEGKNNRLQSGVGFLKTNGRGGEEKRTEKKSSFSIQEKIEKPLQKQC